MSIQNSIELTSSGDIVLENEYLRYVIGADGQSKSFIDKLQNKDYRKY